MQYPRFRAEGWPIASGSGESANKLVVEARLKGVGMHWAVNNVNPMLALRNALCNDRWVEVWEQIRSRAASAGTSAAQSATDSICLSPLLHLTAEPTVVVTQRTGSRLEQRSHRCVSVLQTVGQQRSIHGDAPGVGVSGVARRKLPSPQNRASHPLPLRTWSNPQDKRYAQMSHQHGTLIPAGQA